MISSTRTRDAWRSSAATRQHTSRSVTTPTTFSAAASSTTGEHPHPESRIARAASAAVSRGVQHDDAAIGSITSPQQPMSIPPRWRSRAVCVSRARPIGGTARCRSVRRRGRRRRRRREAQRSRPQASYNFSSCQSHGSQENAYSVRTLFAQQKPWTAVRLAHVCLCHRFGRKQ